MFAVATSADFPISIDVFVPCANGGAGEIVSLSGNLHAVFSTTLNANNVHFTAEFNPRAVNGVGLTTGEKYQGTGVTRFDTNMNVAGFPFTFTFVNNFRIIGQGTDNNFLVHENVHVTINADGTMTVFVDNFSVACK